MIPKQSGIDSQLYEIKKWYQHHFPLCGYCGHLVRGSGELSHFIRRSYSRELQTEKLNTCLAHPDCHTIYDDSPDQAIYLPRIIEVLYIVYLLDVQYFNLIAGHYEQLADVLQLFPSVSYQKIEHHGELLTLQYLY